MSMITPLPSEIAHILAAVDGSSGLAPYAQAARQLRPLREQLRTTRISQLATYTIAPLSPFLEVEAARCGLSAEIQIGPFNSVQQQLLDPQSECAAFQPHVVFIAQLLDDVCPLLGQDFLSLERDAVESQIERTVAELFTAVDSFRERSPASIVIHNFPLPQDPLLGIYEASADATQTQAIRRLNEQLREAAQARTAVHLLDFARVCSQVGYAHWLDRKMWYLGRAPLSALMLPALAIEQASFLDCLAGGRRKCLVLDLDNTLWGGIVGEHGVAGIKLGDGFPGNVYKDIQRAALQLHRRGVLLAINSKNNEEDVRQVLASHPDMLLKPEHFACQKINWRPKPDNMLEIAGELNIGVDSLVFLDDSPAECELMRQALPEVLTLGGYDSKGAADPLSMVRLLSVATPFQQLSLNAEDRRRGQMYAEQSARKQLERSARSLDEFLRSLEMTVAIEQVDEFSFSRVLDLIHKTNQFNLTTRRHSEAKLNEFMRDSDYGVFSLRVSDRFGDNGIVGAAVVKLDADKGIVDTFLLSCRVIGRNIESAFLWELIQWAKARGAEVVEGEFVPTAKNAPAADLYERHHFHRTSDVAQGESRWKLSIDELAFEWPAYIRQVEKELVQS